MVGIKSSENVLNSKLCHEGEAEKAEKNKSSKDRKKVHQCNWLWELPCMSLVHHASQGYLEWRKEGHLGGSGG